MRLWTRLWVAHHLLPLVKNRMQVDCNEDRRDFQKDLLTWWQLPGNARSFPWRAHKNRTTYRTLIAELMLRRTQADQVARVYEAFLLRYPELPEALAAPDDELREVLYPLGLAWRIENIVALFQSLRERKCTDVPESLAELMALPGVGDYVANAVRCFALGDSSATLIDVNVTRVLGRIFGLPVNAEARRRKPMRELAMATVDRERPAEYHYAILDFAALVCTALRPRCAVCPFGLAGRCNIAFSVSEK
jgi:A/G-specific adenine glycosylase